MNLKEKSQLWDAMYGFPRPANEQYLSSYKAFLRLSKDASSLFISLVFSLFSVALVIYTFLYALSSFRLAYTEGVGALAGLFSLVFLFAIGLMFLLDATSVFLPYRLEFQRESHGGRTWATVKDLANPEVDAVRPADDEIEGKGVFLAPFKRSLVSFAESKHQIFLSLKRMAQAIIIYGPPGSGKSSTFFIPVIRQFAACGGAIVLDVKGELYNYSAHYFANVYRLDIMNPFHSDWFDLFGGCYRNPDLARRIASYLVGYDPNKSNSKEPIWDQSAVAMLAIIILHLCEMKEHPTARDILRFLAANPITDKRWNEAIGKMSPYSPLTEAFQKSKSVFARDVWMNNFSKMPEDTFGSVKFNVDTALAQLLSPRVNEILRPPTADERKKGRRRIDFTQLREMFEFGKKSAKKRGTAVYIVVSPSDSINMDVFLRVIFSVALDTLREKAKTGTHVLVALDEAGNVPLSKLPEGINTDRGVGICYFLGYQDKNQPVSQYGREGAHSFLGTAGVNIFLPGVDDDTADMASKRIGETTILQRSSSDAKNNGWDSEKLSEAGRKLIMPQDLTSMKWFTQCVITIKGVAPIRTKIPSDGKNQDTRISRPRRIVDKVSEEVLRELDIIKGRNNEDFLPAEHINFSSASSRDKSNEQPTFIAEKKYFAEEVSDGGASNSGQVTAVVEDAVSPEPSEQSSNFSDEISADPARDDYFPAIKSVDTSSVNTGADQVVSAIKQNPAIVIESTDEEWADASRRRKK